MYLPSLAIAALFRAGPVLPLPAPPADSLALVALNHGYVQAFVRGDAAWYDAHLWPEFEALEPDGSITNRAAFLEGARAPMRYRAFREDSVRVKLLGDVALITAITPYTRADGTRGTSRYTDTWVRRHGAWKVLHAQITPMVRR